MPLPTRPFLLPVLFAALATPAAGQDLSGRIEGFVLGPDGRPLSGVLVDVSDDARRLSVSYLTGTNGRFRSASLALSSYRLTLSRTGYATRVIEDVKVEPRGLVSIGTIRMTEAPVALDPLVVSGLGPSIDPVSAAATVTLRPRYYDLLPTGRSFTSVLSSLPHVNTSFLGDGLSVGGNTGLENVYLIDGVNVTDPYQAAEVVDLPAGFIDAVTVQTGGISAESGRALGGIVSAATRSGTNHLAVDLFAYAAPDYLSLEPKDGRLEQTTRRLRRFDIGTAVSGPVVPGTAWFVVAYNPLVETREVSIGPSLGHVDRRVVHRFASKVDWVPNARLRLSLSAFGDPEANEEVAAILQPPPAILENPDPILQSGNAGSTTVALRGHLAISADLEVEAVLARHARWFEVTGRTERARVEPLVIDVRSGTWSGGLGLEPVTGDGRRLSGLISGTMSFGSHRVRIGAEVERASFRLVQRSVEPGLVIRLADSVWSVFTVDEDSPVWSLSPAFFVQDEWSVGERVTLLPGFRWSTQRFYGVGDTLAQSTGSELQPRLGIVFRPGEGNSTKLTASVGRYYQQLPLNLSSTGHGSKTECVLQFSSNPLSPTSRPNAETCISSAQSPTLARVPDVAGEHLDELTLGFEADLGGYARLRLRGVYRTLRDALLIGIAPDGTFVLGNPGRGQLDFLPSARRRYTAFEVSVQRLWDRSKGVLASYVLSSTRGNYTGLYATDVGSSRASNNFAFQLPEHALNTNGSLPSDRPHALKLSAWYRLTSALGLGTSITWFSGTPLSELGASSLPNRPIFLTPRGSAGRTPAIWDWNLRATYEVGSLFGLDVDGRLLADFLHIGNEQQAVIIDQTRFLAVDQDGMQTAPNPLFGSAMDHAPPMSVRLGLELTH